MMHPIWFVVIGLVVIAVYTIIAYCVVFAVWYVVEWFKDRLSHEKQSKKGVKR